MRPLPDDVDKIDPRSVLALSRRMLLKSGMAGVVLTSIFMALGCAGQPSAAAPDAGFFDDGSDFAL